MLVFYCFQLHHVTWWASSLPSTIVLLLCFTYLVNFHSCRIRVLNNNFVLVPPPSTPHPLGFRESTTHQHFWVFQNQIPAIPSTSFLVQVEVEYFSSHQGKVLVYLSCHDWSKPRQILKHLLHCNIYLGCLMKLPVLRFLQVRTEILQRNKRSCLPQKRT